LRVIKLVAVSAFLPIKKQSAVLEFVLFVKGRAGLASAENGDAAWERIISQPTAYPKLDAFLREAVQQGEEPLNPARL
jgi:hypothetical protein